MWKRYGSLPVRPTRPFPAPIEANCWHDEPPAISNKAFGGMLSTSFRSTAPRPSGRPHALLASRWTGMVGPSRSVLAHQRTTASDRR
eukprot:3699288-Alexandrium_andersonii.AAC.1